MSKEKLEKDFQGFNAQIDSLADEELKRIKEKASVVMAQASEIGEQVEQSVKDSKAK